MKCIRKIRASLLILAVMVTAIGQTARAEDSVYLYGKAVCRQPGDAYGRRNHSA